MNQLHSIQATRIEAASMKPAWLLALILLVSSSLTIPQNATAHDASVQSGVVQSGVVQSGVVEGTGSQSATSQSAASQSAAAQNPASQDAMAILQGAAERHEGLDGFCAHFRQVVVNDILRETMRSQGELCQAHSDRFEMRFSDPEGDRVVADGEHIWIYLPSADPGQVFQGDLNGGSGQFDLHREFLSEPGERYRPNLEGQEEVDGRNTFVLALEPTGMSPFLRARIWVDAQDSMLRKLEITEDEGFVRTVELRDIRLNPEIAPERFHFDPPSGAQVIRR